MAKMIAFLVIFLLFFLVITHYVPHVSARNSIRIVDEPASYGIGVDLIQADVRESPPASNSLFAPANFSGPQQLNRLKGRCFDLLSGKYRYSLCPFDNVTQSSVNHWPASHVVLGIWQGWEITNNTFQSMLMANGDLCGKERRQVKVKMSCDDDDADAIANVTEPDKCRYKIHFRTRLVCHPESLLVYPRLPAFLRDQWDELYTRFVSKDITEKGYEAELSKIFVLAGLQTPQRSPLIIIDASPNTESVVETPTTFESLPQCQLEYQKLQKELDSLRLLLALNDLPGEDTNT